MFTAPQGVLPLPEEQEDEVGNHCVAMIGWDDETNNIIFANSWGLEWGDDGCGYMSRDYFDRYVTDAWLVRHVRVGPHPAKIQRFRRSTDIDDFTQTWMLENPRWRRRFRHARSRLEWVIYETISITGHIVEVIELRTGYGLRLGWAHVFHYCGENQDTSIVKELFVWPAFREQGLGVLIEKATVSVAKKYGAKKVQVWLHAADYVHGSQSPGKTFGEKVGYRWDSRVQERPCLVATGEKVL